MGAYRLLLSVTVEHVYFLRANCKMLEFVLTGFCANQLRNADLLVKSSESGIAVYFDEEKINILRLRAEDDLTLTFKIFSKDSNFFRYTSPGAPPDNAILFFSNRHITHDVSGKQMLHSDASVTENDWLDMAEIPSREVLERQDFFVKPVFILQLSITIGAGGLCSDLLDAAMRKFYIRFATNQTFWRYYVSGDLSKRNVCVTDLENIVHFTNLGNILLPGNREAIQLQSSKAIPLNEQPSQRFQLKESTDAGEKVLIRYLPNPVVDQVHGEILGDRLEYISEIYVN